MCPWWRRRVPERAGTRPRRRGVGALRGILPDNVPRAAGIAVDTPVLTFAAFVTVATGLLFGLAPALFAARSDLAGVLKEGLVGSRVGTVEKTLQVLRLG